ncbi:MAG TPA: ATP-binding cassette domain-containing protein [Streptosporangiaceae bacterium]
MTVLAPGGGAAGPPGDPAAVQCEQITYTFGSHTAVDHLDLRIEPGETFGLLGPNGAGKTTTIRMLVTLLKPMSGLVSVFGVNAVAQPMLVRRMIGYVPQLLSADGTLTGRENVELFARLFDVPRKQRPGRVDGALAAMGLRDAASRRARTYSGGMIRRLELAQALVNAPRLLILDEPTVGLDPIARTDVWDHISKLRDEYGMTVLMTTHYMDEADLYCDRIALMHLGRIRAAGTPADLKQALGADASLDEVFRHHTGGTLEEDDAGKAGIRNVRRARSTARRLG